MLLLNILVTVFTVILATTVVAVLATVTFSDEYEVKSLKINEHQGFGENA